MDKEQKQQEEQSPFDQAAAHVMERCAWYADRHTDMVPYSGVYKLISAIVSELAAAHKQTVATMQLNHASAMLDRMEHEADLLNTLGAANDMNDALIEYIKESLKAYRNTIEFEKRTRLELPRDANGNRIYPDSMLKGWGAIEDFWYTNGYWRVRGHDTSAPWIPAEEAVVCQEDREDKPEEHSDHATTDDTPKAKCQRGCKSRSEADDVVKALCLGILPITALIDLLCPPDDDDASEEA